MKPELIIGGAHVDVRGRLRFCNDFNMSAVKRFYTIANSEESSARGWIGHKMETKWFFPLSGKTEIVVESFNAETQRCRDTETFVLDANTPAVLKVPPGNWFCIKQFGNAEVMVFSDCTIGQYDNDDYRRPYEET